MDKPQDVEARAIVGGLIAAIGVGVLALAVAALQASWFKDHAAALNPFWLLVPAMLAAAALFAAFNPEADPGFTRRQRAVEATGRLQDELDLPLADFDPPPGDVKAQQEKIRRETLRAEREAARRRPARIRMTALALASLAFALVCVAGVAKLAAEVRNHPATTSRFALALPPDVAPAAGLTTKPVVLSWEVTRNAAPPGLTGGALPIALGGLFLVALGAWFPHVGFSGVDTAHGTLSKIIAPMLSLALVALGASQQAEAARVESDMKLAEQGLPATVNVSPAEQQARMNFYILTGGRMAPEGLEEIEKSLTSLSDDLTDHRTRVDMTAGALELKADVLVREIERLRLVADRPPSKQSVSVDELAGVKSSLEAIQKAAKERQEVSDASRCRLLARQLADFTRQAKSHEDAAAAKQAAPQRQAHKRFVDWWRGTAPTDRGLEDRQAAAAYGRRAAEAAAEHETLCPMTQTAGL